MTLQFFRIVDRIALREGLDLRLTPYAVTATGRELGLVEVVKHADTIARMQWAGGGPWDKKPLFDFILTLQRRQRVCKGCAEDISSILRRICGDDVRHGHW